MTFYSVIFIAFGLAMDAFAVAVSNGVAIEDFQFHQKIKMSLFFGIFQCIMPIIGFFLGRTVASFIVRLDHWIAFALLTFIGVNMILEALKEDVKSVNKRRMVISTKTLVLQAIATSIDALVIGITFAVLDGDILFPAAVIGLVCFILSFTGASAGEKLGGIVKEKAEILGGLMLVGIGLKTLIEHLFF